MKVGDHVKIKKESAHYSQCLDKEGNETIGVIIKYYNKTEDNDYQYDVQFNKTDRICKNSYRFEDLERYYNLSEKIENILNKIENL